MWERIAVKGGVGVDRENKVIHGYVVAQAGRFKSKGRGQFDDKALSTIVELGNATRNGLKSRLAHPTLSSDGIGKHLGRARNLRMDSVQTAAGVVKAVRADLHLDPTSFNTPSGNLGGYVMDLAQSDPDAFSSSLVLQANKEQALDAEGRPAKDEDGTPHPPLWRPTALHASDVVDTGDAVDGFLSAPGGTESLSIEGLPDSFARFAALAIEENFPGLDRHQLKEKFDEYIQAYLSWKFGEEENKPDFRTKRNSEILRRIRQCGIDSA